jgi:hypothetical protein
MTQYVRNAFAWVVFDMSEAETKDKPLIFGYGLILNSGCATDSLLLLPKRNWFMVSPVFGAAKDDPMRGNARECLHQALYAENGFEKANGEALKSIHVR